MTVPASLTGGNIGLQSQTGPPTRNLDLSVFKDFPITERFKLQFRSDFLNTFNRVNLASPNTTVQTSTTGVINASQPPRNIQLALKLYF